MPVLFWRQLRGLVWKNWIVLTRRPISNLIFCVLLPIIYALFLASAQSLFGRESNLGLGKPAPVLSFEGGFDGKLTLVWIDNTTTAANPTPRAIIDRLTVNFNAYQRSAIKELAAADGLRDECQQNWSGTSPCYAAIWFNSIQGGPGAIDYTLLVDEGLGDTVNIDGQKSDYEKRVLPIQWAIDKAIIELQTGVSPPTPREWIYTIETNEEQRTRRRLGFVRAVGATLGIGMFIAFLGIIYQLPGAIANERTLLITEHMKAMGLLDSARIVSWHVSYSLVHLPSWISFAIIYKVRLFVKTNILILLVVHVLFGLVLASWALFVTVPFRKSPQLAAVMTSFIAVVLTILGIVLKSDSGVINFILSILFPPILYVLSLKTISGYERHELATNLVKGDPTRGRVLLPLIVAGIIDVILWPCLAVLWERYLYDTANSAQKSPWYAFWSKTETHAGGDDSELPEDLAISIRDLTKIYKGSRFSKKGDVTAVSNLSLDVPKTGIFVLLGSNGAGKSTSLSIIGGLSSLTSGTVKFAGGKSRPPRGTLGLVPQKNVLFPGLTCLQTLKVWQSVKWSSNSETEEDLEQLLRDCDLEKKIHARAENMSGGQKRKLQLAIGLVGGSKIVLVDECTSGVDPLSRRALWKTLTNYRDDRSIVFTTHFLDEADLLGDYIAILAAPGKVLAQGPPVTLKQTLGEGYSIQVTFTFSAELNEKDDPPQRDHLLDAIRRIAPHAYATTLNASQACYHLKEKDVGVVQQILKLLDQRAQEYGIFSFDVLGTTIEDIFLSLMRKEDNRKALEAGHVDTLSSLHSFPPKANLNALYLTNGRPVSFLRQGFTIFYKRLLITKRSWLTPFLTVVLAIAGACIPLLLIKDYRQTCIKTYDPSIPTPLLISQFPLNEISSTFNGTIFVQNPSDLLRTLVDVPAGIPIVNTADQSGWENYIGENYRNIRAGGVSYEAATGSLTYAYEGAWTPAIGPAMQNLASNLLYRRSLNASGNAAAGLFSTINTNFGVFPELSEDNFKSLDWVLYFGAAMAIYPAFFALYVSKERKTSVQTMQLSNGLTDPIGLWIGHLMFDSLAVLLSSTVIVVVFAAALPGAFVGLGFLWLVLVLYGICGALFSYCVTLFASSPLAAFAIAGGYQFVIYLLYFTAYMLIEAYGDPTKTFQLISISHFTISITAPVASVARAGFLTVNAFSILCEGTDNKVDAGDLIALSRFGGPILYLVLYSLFLLSILVWWESGSLLPRKLLSRGKAPIPTSDTAHSSREDVYAAAEVAAKSDDLLRVLNISKTYAGKKVVDDVTLSVGRDTVFALLGPNGAGKTTTFNIIRGDVVPESGDVLINGTSVVRNPKTARSSLGVCPQFTAIDSQLTVREHLVVYGRLKGLRPGVELNESIDSLLEATALRTYADRLANKLSGGNQRKLSLAIAMMGNPSVILIDEFSTGIDPKMKREMWGTLRKVAKGKAVVITTHSMEEASALANGVGIIAKRVLAVGTTESLSARFANYEVHFTCRTREEVVRARSLMSSIPGSRMADDVATRFEVPIQAEGINSGSHLTLSELFQKLAASGAFAEYTVEKASLESVFLKVIRQNDVAEEDAGDGSSKKTGFFGFFRK